MLVAMNSTGHTMRNYYVFKGKWPREEYISLYEDEECLGTQENGYMESENFSTWMTFFIRHHERRGSLGPSKRMLLILDGHKSYVTMEVLLKAKSHGVDMVSLPFHTSHELQPLDISCFKPFKQACRTYRDIWARTNIGKKATKQHLAQWVSLDLIKALTPKNIKSRFRTAGIYPLNKEAMVTKMGAHENFQHNERTPEDSQEEEEVPSQECEEETNLQVEEIIEEGLPSPPKHYTHYYVSVEEEPTIPSTTCSLAEPNSTQPLSQFLKLPQIEVSMLTRGRVEPIIDYSHSQILTSNEHVGKLRRIANKKAMVGEEKAAKLKERELNKRRRAKEKVLEAAAKKRRASELEARKLAKKNWTTTAIRAADERMQQLVKNSCQQQIRQPRLDVEARGIAKQNKLIAKAK